MDGAHLIGSKLSEPLKSENGQIVARVVLNLTVYFHDLSEEDFLQLLGLYQRYCPDNRMSLYTTTEWHGWAPIDTPRVTDSVVAAMASGDPWPTLAPVKRRIHEGRGFELRFWDGNEIENEAGSWSFSCLKVLQPERNPFCFVSILLPLFQNPSLILNMAYDITESVPIHSGHGGLAFTYSPFQKIDAFEKIYALSKRYWGIDVEDLNASARSKGEFLKTISWLTLLGNPLFSSVVEGLDSLADDADIVQHKMHHGMVIRVRTAPDAFDIHRPTTDAYHRLATRLEPVLPTEHYAFEGLGFGTEDATVDWLRRFVDPNARR